MMKTSFCLNVISSFDENIYELLFSTFPCYNKTSQLNLIGNIRFQKNHKKSINHYFSGSLIFWFEVFLNYLPNGSKKISFLFWFPSWFFWSTYKFTLIMSWWEIYALLIVFMPTCKATYQPAILPSLSKFCLQFTSFLQTSISPQLRAQLSEAKNCYYPRFLTDFIIGESLTWP